MSAGESDHELLGSADTADLLEIFRYIALELRAEQNALSQLSRLEEAIASLDIMPERYRVYDSPKHQSRNIRIMPVDNYLVFYVPDKDEHKVTVLRVMYGGRDIGRHFGNPE